MEVFKYAISGCSQMSKCIQEYISARVIKDQFLITSSRARVNEYLKKSIFARNAYNELIEESILPMKHSLGYLVAYNAPEKIIWCCTASVKVIPWKFLKACEK
nr:hypothetical protein [Candidatus Cloacimonadota bacterium]